MGIKVMEVFFVDDLEFVEEEEEVKGVQVDVEILKIYVGKFKVQQLGFIIEYKLENG